MPPAPHVPVDYPPPNCGGRLRASEAAAARFDLPYKNQLKALRDGTVRAVEDGLRMEITRTLHMRRSELDKYLIEMLDQDTWIQGIRYMLADPGLDGRPWPHYRGEEHVWL